MPSSPFQGENGKLIFVHLKTQLLSFQTDISRIEIPNEFNFPFYYVPHQLAKIAASELQGYLQKQDEWKHNFGFEDYQEGQAQGKMFGVLVVKDKEGHLSYLVGFSGRLAGKSLLEPFVPPVYDTLVEGEFYREGEKELALMTDRLEFLENSEDYHRLKEQVEEKKRSAERRLEAEKASIREARQVRRRLKNEAKDQLSPAAFAEFEIRLAKESTHRNYALKKLKLAIAGEKTEIDIAYEKLADEIETLRETRKQKSNALQRQIFEQFQFLNAKQEKRSLYTIFQNTVTENPPAGAGDCAAPKLLHYAFQNHLEPLCMAEFWWGIPPKKEVRKHRQFYPACRGKCEPILGHMLQGLKVASNPMLEQQNAPEDIEIVYEDEHILAVNKPPEFLSVPGKNVEDSVFLRIKERYPEATGPLIVHRLDMSTSGIMLLAKSRAAHKNLQDQFKRRSISKRYVAILEGPLKGKEGLINLPLRVDLNDRPRQLVCYEYGKAAITKWELIEQAGARAKVYFYPLTGRTHQLRLHAAHSLGLGTPILGDDLYGSPSDRLYLHAQSITFKHPSSKKEMNLEAPVDWKLK